MRRNAWVAFALVLPLLGSCGLAGVRGSGEVITESREVSGFTEIALQGSGTVNVEMTGTESLTIEAEDNLMPLLSSEVKDGRLVLSATEPLSPTEEIVYTVTVARLDGVSIGGSGALTGSEIEAGVFEISVSGSGTANVDQLAVDELIVSISGSGGVEVGGTARHLEVSLSGSGNFLGERLPTPTAVVDVSGSGDAIVNVSDHLEAEVSGSGRIEYLGDPPSVDASISGSGEIERG